jgi:pilus assembly protein Flp/PilA
MARKVSAGTREQGRAQGSVFHTGCVNREWAMKRLMKIFRCSKGGTAIEYALVASLISIAAIGAMNGLGNRIDAMFNNVSSHL